MREIEKDPDTRYQSCREMLEDLRTYRSLNATPGNPQSTMAMSPDAVNGGVAMSRAGLRGAHADDTAAAARALSARATHPGQTPALRRTGTLAPLPEPKPRKNVFGTIVAALLLLGVIAYCANKLRPIYEDVRQRRSAAPSDTVTPSDGSAGAASEPNSAASIETAPENSDSATSDANGNANEMARPATTPVPDGKF